MPWAKRAEELEQSEGPYSDYAAFCEWLEAWNARQQPSIQFDTDAVDKTSLYIAFFAACSEIANAANRKISRLEYMVDLNAAKITAQANTLDHLRDAMRQSCRDDRSEVLGGCPLLHKSA